MSGAQAADNPNPLSGSAASGADSHAMFLRILLEEPADFLNPYWYEQLDGLNWSEEGHRLVIYDKVGPVWNPRFPSSLFLNHGIRRVHVVLTSTGGTPKTENWLAFFMSFLPLGKKIMMAGKGYCGSMETFQEHAEDLFKKKKAVVVSFPDEAHDEKIDMDPEGPSFSQLQRMLLSADWVLFHEGNGFSIFFTDPIGKGMIHAVARKSAERGWPLYWVKNIYDFRFSEREAFKKNHELPATVKRMA